MQSSIESPCGSGPCKNGGRCHQVAAFFRCRCRPGYKGKLCEIKGKVNSIGTRTLYARVDNLLRYVLKDTFLNWLN